MPASNPTTANPTTATPAANPAAPSSPPASNPAAPSSQPASFLERLAIFLMPYFLTMTPDRALAHSDIVETLQSCGARTRFELIIAAKALACDLSALDLLAESKIMDMSESMRLRYASCAGGLGRLGRQILEKLERRLASQPAQPSPAPSSDTRPAQPSTARSSDIQPSPAHPSLAHPAPANPALVEPADAQVEATLQTMQANIQAHRNRLAPTHPRTDNTVAGHPIAHQPAAQPSAAHGSVTRSPAAFTTSPPLHPTTSANHPSAAHPSAAHPGASHFGAHSLPRGNPLFDAAVPRAAAPLAATQRATGPVAAAPLAAAPLAMNPLDPETLAAQAAAAQAAANRVLTAHVAATRAAPPARTPLR